MSTARDSTTPRGVSRRGGSRSLHSKGGRLVRSVLWTMVLALVLATTVLLGGCGNSGQQQPAAPLYVLPFPGTPDASRYSEIVFMSLSPSDLASVKVTGSSSGDHNGSLQALPNNGGTAFVPQSPFAAAETVSVDAQTVSAAAAEAAGGKGGTRLQFSFTTVADISVSRTPLTSTTASGGQINPPQPPPTWTYQSQPALHPPMVTIPVADQDPGAGLIFVDAQFAAYQGPLILDGSGQVVWFQQLNGGEWAMDVNVQTYQGQPVLTWWQGNVETSGHGAGEGKIYDTSYQQVASVQAGAGYEADLHEFLLTPRGTAYITIYSPAKADLSGLGGPADGQVYDGIVQEIDIASGRVLWEWHALGHVPVTDSYRGAPGQDQTYDYFHINSVQELDNGDLLISARNTWSVYRVSRNTGQILWQLGGKHSSFTMAPGLQFEWQHDARLSGDLLTLFNNASDPRQEYQSRALFIQLDTSAMTASLKAGYTHTPPALSGSQGNVQILPNGNIFVGWGDQPYFTEFAPSGQTLFDGKFPGAVQSYRAFRYPWTAQPVGPPATALGADGSGNPAVYVSWNGATEVDHWELTAGQDAASAAVFSTASADGFETSLPADTSLPYLAVRAVDTGGKVLATAEVPH